MVKNPKNFQWSKEIASRADFRSNLQFEMDTSKKLGTFFVSTGILSYFSPSMVPIKDGTRARELLHKKVPFIITGVMDHIS